ncbi:desmoplakin [Alphabaculovirus myunipunctae]|uniref:Desmoplakin n=1 Tax=Mythimna unipuncta nucleopolyhedrovirus TaxID=447897 RepID=A0A2K9VSF1_9ABAC|nr:desmoplakin [Mythimna unipuncta nucleopolyhedrovirus]AUV65366.1 desmoplakin [Mythimna unipuncta nucleopolyhedrovirus]
MAYRYPPKYKNTDVSADTVHNLLQTINNMSQRCRNQNNTEDVIQRVRSIILMHRPHLSLRTELQLPELVTEALIPNTSSIPNQITHNYNYKYDYNTNVVPNAATTTTTIPPPQPPPASPFPPTPPAPSSSSMAMETSSMPPPAPPAPPTSSTLSISDQDMLALNEAYFNAQQNNTVAAYKFLLEQAIFVVRKYVRIDMLVLSLQLVSNFDAIRGGDLAELLACIADKSGWSIPSHHNVCQLVTIVVQSYCRIAFMATKQQLVMSAIQNETQLQTQTRAVEEALGAIIFNANSTNGTQDLLRRENEQLKSQIEYLSVKNTQLDTERMAAVNNYAMLDNRNTLLVNAFQRLQNFLNKNTMGSFNTDDVEQFVTSAMNKYNEMSSTLTQNTIALQTEQRLAEERTEAIQNEMQKRNEQLSRQLEANSTRVAQLELQLIQFENVQSELMATKARLAEMEKAPPAAPPVVVVEPAVVAAAAASDEPTIADLQLELAQTKLNYESNLSKLNDLQREYDRLAKSSKRPQQMVAARPRGISPRKQTQVNLDKIAKNLNNLLRDSMQNKNLVRGLRNKQNVTLENAETSVKQLKTSVQDTIARINNLVSAQATLDKSELTMLNTLSEQALSDRLSDVIAQRDSLAETCNDQIRTESRVLEERFQNSRRELLNEVDNLVSMIRPLQEEMDSTKIAVGQFEERYEQLARSSALLVQSQNETNQ